MAIYGHVYCTVRNSDGKNMDKFVKIFLRQLFVCKADLIVKILLVKFCKINAVRHHSLPISG